MGSRVLEHMRTHVHRLSKENRAYVALAFAMALLPTVGLFALVIDYGVMSRTKAQLDSAADSAVIATTTATADAYVSNGGDFASARQHGISAGLAWYKTQMASTGERLDPSLPTPSIDVIQNGTTFTALLNYAAQSPGSFSALFGMSSYKLTGSSSSTFTLPGYLDIQILMDTSPSMAIIADPFANNNSNWQQYSQFVKANFPGIYSGGNDMQNYDCVFACHRPDRQSNVISGYNKDGTPIWNQNTDTYNIAEYFGQNVLHTDLLRIDVMTSAVKKVIQAIGSSSTADHYRIGLYTFDDDVSQLYPLSNDIASAATAAKTVTLLPAYNNSYHTNFVRSVSTMVDKYLTSPGDGLSSATSAKALFIITDGVNNVPSGGGNATSVFATTSCDQIKAIKSKAGQAIDVYVLYTKYLQVYYRATDKPPSTSDFNGTYANEVYYPMQASKNSAGDDKITAALKACASSPDKFFYASDPASIQTSLAAMMQAALAAPNRFTK